MQTILVGSHGCRSLAQGVTLYPQSYPQSRSRERESLCVVCVLCVCCVCVLCVCVVCVLCVCVRERERERRERETETETYRNEC